MSGQFTQARREKAEGYLAEGKPWQARDYLMGLMGHVRYDEELYVYCGRTFLALGEEERAGLYWALTTDASDEAARCIAAAQNKFGHKLLANLRVYVRPSQLPAEVRDRLRDVLTGAGVRGVDSVFRRDSFQPADLVTKISDRFFCLGCAVVFAIAAILFISGIIFWINLLFS